MWFQGEIPSKQPLVDTFGNILLWNGDVFYGFNDFPANNHDSDGSFLLNKLQQVDNVEDICAVFEAIKGPSSFIYYHKKLNIVITGKDCFGRHSLLWNYQGESPDLLVVSSVSIDNSFREVPAVQLYAIGFSNDFNVEPVSSRKPYIINKQIPSDDELSWDAGCPEKNNHKKIYQLYRDVWDKELELFETALYESIKARVQCQPPFCKVCAKTCRKKGSNEDECNHSKLAILFSGGLDSTVLAAIADQIWPKEEPIDLLNVAFQSKISSTVKNFEVPDRLTGLQALEELKQLNPNRKWNFIKVCIILGNLIHSF